MAWRAVFLGLVLVASTALVRAQGFDHNHAVWQVLLAKHVKAFGGGNAGAVDYAALKNARAALQAYLASLSAVGEADYGKWSKPRTATSAMTRVLNHIKTTKGEVHEHYWEICRT